VELSIPYRICAHILPDGNIWGDKGRYRKNTAAIMPTKGRVGKNKRQIQEYIQNQLTEDQIGLKEFVDPFTGRENKKHKERPLRGGPRKECGRQTIRGPFRGNRL